MVIIALFVPPVVNLLAVFINRSSIAYEETKIVMLATTKIEEIKSIPFKNLVTTTNSTVAGSDCLLSWRIVKEENRAKIFVNASCPSAPTRSVALKTILLP